MERMENAETVDSDIDHIVVAIPDGTTAIAFPAYSVFK